MEQERRELRSGIWLSDNRVAISAEVERLQASADLKRAERLTSTHALTTKKNELSDGELTRGYQQRFPEEPQRLGGNRLPAEILPEPGRKGKVGFVVSIKGAKHETKARAVLSEGEHRVVTLAAFLADMRGSEAGTSTPFIFDDPISSLDQEYEERVAARLVEPANTRQVIIFTRRLSLRALVEYAVERLEREKDDQVPAMGLITIRRLGSAVGTVVEDDIRRKKPLPGFRELRNNRMPRIQRYLRNGDAGGYDLELKVACSDFRILMERTVETVMLNGVLERLRRSVQTQQISSLTKINLETIDGR